MRNLLFSSTNMVERENHLLACTYAGDQKLRRVKFQSSMRAQEKEGKRDCRRAWGRPKGEEKKRGEKVKVIENIFYHVSTTC